MHPGHSITKRCSVAFDTPQGVRECELSLPAGATVAEAVAAARQQLGLQPVDEGAVGIFGQPCGPDHVPGPGDRIELYRPLAADPRAARRARLSRGSGAIRRGRGT